MIAPDPLRGNGHVVDSLGHALRSGEHGLSTVPGLLKRVLAEGSWREFVTERGEHMHYDGTPGRRFADFVTTPPLKGLGATVELVRRIVASDTEALDRLDQALQNPVGGSVKVNLNVNNINDGNDLERPEPPRGTSKDYALRKLRSDAPELHAEVLADRLSAHAAMVQAGFRHRTFSVRADDAASAAAALRKHMTPDQLVELARLLADER